MAGNWKMNKTIGETIELANGLKRSLYNIEDVDIVVCPPFTALSEAAEMLADTNICLGAQDLFWEEKGAYTGEVSAAMLKDAGARYVIIGHSERRQYFHEANEAVNKKLRKALAAGLSPIMCVGEKLEERESNKTFEVVEDHVAGGLRDITEEDAAKVIIAYEPVWAIGTGRTATPAQAQEAHSFIRGLLSKLYSKDLSLLVRIQYGGSVTPGNAASLMEQPDLDGALVGGASLKAESFTDIVKKSSEVKRKCTHY